jgi:hypothetical protein
VTAQLQLINIIIIFDLGTLFPWRRTAHRELSPINYNYITNNTIQHVNRMPRNRLHSVMKYYSPTGRRNHGRPLKKLLDTWDRNRSTSGPTPWKIYAVDDDDNTINSSLTTVFLLGISYYYTHILRNNTAVRSIHQRVLFVGLKYKVPYCVNTHTMTQGSTQPVTEMSTRNISLGVKAAGAERWHSYHLHVPMVLKSGSINLLELSGPLQACTGIDLPFTITACNAIWRKICNCEYIMI